MLQLGDVEPASDLGRLATTNNAGIMSHVVNENSNWNEHTINGGTHINNIDEEYIPESESVVSRDCYVGGPDQDAPLPITKLDSTTSIEPQFPRSRKTSPSRRESGGKRESVGKRKSVTLQEKTSFREIPDDNDDDSVTGRQRPDLIEANSAVRRYGTSPSQKSADEQRVERHADLKNDEGPRAVRRCPTSPLHGTVERTASKDSQAPAARVRSTMTGQKVIILNQG